ncbi:unnamed protein product, partial [Nesidiocoris tenuis]
MRFLLFHVFAYLGEFYRTDSKFFELVGFLEGLQTVFTPCNICVTRAKNSLSYDRSFCNNCNDIFY